MKENDSKMLIDQNSSEFEQNENILSSHIPSILHDFNNNIQTITSYLDLLKKKKISEYEIGKYVDAFEETIIQSITSLNHLLMVLRNNKSRLEKVDLNSFLTNITRNLDIQFSNIKIEYEEKTEPMWVLGNRDDLYNALLNLVLNAKEAISERGIIIISLSEISEPANSSNPKIYHKITIEDNGKGMDGETLCKIFDPYFTTKGDSNTGLGLTSTLNIVKYHNGLIKTMSRIGKGSKFEILLPKAEI